MESLEGRFGEFEDSTQISSILNALSAQRTSSKLCDVILRISDDQIYAHSNVLAAASPYFDGLFSGQDLPRVFSQKTPQIIEIHIDGPTDPGYRIAVQRVVDFMYTSQIHLEYGILTQIIEIAKIMQMANIIEFCDLFQQGFNSYPIVDAAKKQKQTSFDVVTQTQESSIKKESNEFFVVMSNTAENPEIESEWKYKKNLKRRPVMLLESKKRGRPKRFENYPVHGKVDEKENLDKEKIDEINDGDRRNLSERKLTHEIGYPEKSKMRYAERPQRVSKRGRVIKPRLFSDDILTDIKLEICSDTENDSDEIVDSDTATGKQDGGKLNDQDESMEKSEEADGTVSPRVVKLEMHSGMAMKYACDMCEFSSSKMKEYNDHHREHLHAEKKCSYCGWVCENPDVSEKEFEEHLKNHTGPEPFFCNFCCARFKTRTKLFLHLPKHSKSKPFVCDICQAGFKWKHALKNHMIVHKKTKEFLCDICGFSTAHKTQLKAHHLIHTGETFKCSEPGCDYQATKKTNLKFHMMSHTGEKPHQCDICGTAFSLVKNMKRHMLLHTNDRPYRCERCSFCTTRFDKLKEHYFKQHNIGKKPGKKFRLSEYLKVGQEITETEMEEGVLDIDEDMETIELQVAEESNGTASGVTQIVNVTSSSGEAIPIAITQVGTEISYEIQQYPVQFVTSQEVVSQEIVAE